MDEVQGTHKTESVTSGSVLVSADLGVGFLLPVNEIDDVRSMGVVLDLSLIILDGSELLLDVLLDEVERGTEEAQNGHKILEGLDEPIDSNVLFQAVLVSFSSLHDRVVERSNDSCDITIYKAAESTS